jgi:hypothetical protein
MKNIFADKATLILRKMIQNPDKKWVVRDFVGKEGVSIGMAQAVLQSMLKKGYVERIKKGPNSYTILTNMENLIADWAKAYQFESNEIETYYSYDKNILEKIVKFMDKRKYALTLHTGANIITSFVRTNDIYLYLDKKTWTEDILELRQKLDLKELVKGGNIHFVKSYYKNSVFYNLRKIQGYNIVSNLQLYFDLYNYQPRGREHAEHLKKFLEEKGRKLD